MPQQERQIAPCFVLRSESDLDVLFLKALCLVLIIEGLLPFASPKRWRTMMVIMAQVPDRQLRILGLVSMLFGVALLYLLSH